MIDSNKGYRDNAYVPPPPYKAPWYVVRPFVLLIAAIAFSSSCAVNYWPAMYVENEARANKIDADNAAWQKKLEEHRFYCGGFGKVNARDLPAECVAYWNGTEK
jgi:hypothetical protein